MGAHPYRFVQDYNVYCKRNRAAIFCGLPMHRPPIEYAVCSFGATMAILHVAVAMSVLPNKIRDSVGWPMCLPASA